MDALEELRVAQRAGLVLDVGKRGKREAERPRRAGLRKRVAGVQMLEALVREAVGAQPLVALGRALTPSLISRTN